MEIFQLALGFASKAMDKLPDYDEKKRAEFRDLKDAYNTEVKREKNTRDHDLIMNLKEQLTPLMVEIEGLS